MLMFRGLRIALMFFTRIPVGEIKNFETAELNESTRYFPWIGYLVSFILVLSLLLFNQVLSYELSLLLMIAVSCLLTGCFHEDGFVDVCDGFGGGFSVEKKLEIMKDSRIGTYGAAGLWLLLTIKFFSLRELPIERITYCIVFAAVISRLMATIMTKFGHYSREDDLSKSKPLATKLSSFSLLFAISSLLPMFYLKEFREELVYSIALSLVLLFFLKLWGERQIKGYTGDYLGFTQQFIEVSIFILWGTL